MPLIAERERQLIRQRLAGMEGPVKLVVFTNGKKDCAYCPETEQLITELAQLSEKLSAEVYRLHESREKAEEMGVDKVPAIALLGEEDKDYGVRFYGIPAGYEFATLLDDILAISKGRTELSEETKEVLKRLRRPVHIQVFVTPACPHCPVAARMAHQMAIESELVKADVIEASEFPHLAAKYHVYAVPKSVINEVLWVEGAVPEDYFLREVAKAGGVEW